MFYRMYLSSVCHRRQWPDPAYEPYSTASGFFCKVRVNNREYSTDVPYESEDLARDGAAQKAYLICRNFSSNDGMMPGARPGQSTANGVVQGLPVAIGAGRRSNRSSASSYESESSSACDGATSSGGTSPRSLDGAFEQQIPRITTRPTPKPPRRTSGTHHNHHHHHVNAPHVASIHHHAVTAAAARAVPPMVDEYICLCRRATVRAYGRCAWCLRENGWA